MSRPGRKPVRIRSDDRWIDGPPDFHRPETSYRIEVRALRNLERLRG